MTNKEEFLQSIKPTMKLDRDVFLKIYGYEISYPGFAEIALKKLEQVGCKETRRYYDIIITRYEEKYREDIKKALKEEKEKKEKQKKEKTTWGQQC